MRSQDLAEVNRHSSSTIDAILPFEMLDDTLIIWGRRNSFNVQKVMWIVGEMRLEHVHVPAGEDFGLCDTPAYRAINPHGRIPAISHHGEIVWESHSILRYLAAVTRRAPFWRSNPHQRSQAERWMDWCQSTLEPDLMTGLFWELVRMPGDRRNFATITQKTRRTYDHFRLLDTWMADRDYLTGSELSLGDIAVGSTLYRFFSMPIDRPALPNVKRWYDRLCERPAYRTHVMVSYADLEGKIPR